MMCMFSTNTIQLLQKRPTDGSVNTRSSLLTLLEYCLCIYLYGTYTHSCDNEREKLIYNIVKKKLTFLFYFSSSVSYSIYRVEKKPPGKGHEN